MVKEKKARFTICAITSTNVEYVNFCDRVRKSGITYNDIFKAGVERIAKENGIELIKTK